MAISKAKKGSILEDLKGLVDQSQSIVFVKNNGLNVDELLELRGLLRKSGAKMKIAKKTLIRLALKDKNLPEVDDAILEGPIAAAFGIEDQVSVAKILATFAKTHEKLEIMGGMMDGAVLSKAEVMELSAIPSKEELLARFIGAINGPVRGFHGVLHANLRGFVQVLGAISDKKPA